jgi:hypothetical protein
MAKQPEDRYQSMDEFERALGSFAERGDLAAIPTGKPLASERPNPIARDATEPRRNRMTPASLAPTIPESSTKKADYRPADSDQGDDSGELENPHSAGWRSGPFEPPDPNPANGPGEIRWLVGFLAAFGAMALLGIAGLALLSTVDGPSSAGVKPTPNATPRANESPKPAPLSPKAGDKETLDLGDGASLELVFVPPGEFLMGSAPTEDGHNADEAEATLVTLTSGFWMSPTEVTRAQWRAIMKKDPADAPAATPGDGSLPVTQVSWDDARAFCVQLSKRLGREITLPTESQWEYACRAGKTTAYHFGERSNLARRSSTPGSTGRPRRGPSTRRPRRKARCPSA